jgi:hypothetical protein
MMVVEKALVSRLFIQIHLTCYQFLMSRIAVHYFERNLLHRTYVEVSDSASDGKATSALKAFSKSAPLSTRTFSACIRGISNS